MVAGVVDGQLPEKSKALERIRPASTQTKMRLSLVATYDTLNHVVAPSM
jgi:hypothetical protein